MTQAGRLAVVTGAGRGIGAQIATELARRRARVVCADLVMPSDTVAAIGAAAVGGVADVSDPAGRQTIAAARPAPVDTVVNNAAHDPNALIGSLDLARWRQTTSINPDPHFLSAKQFLSGMRRQKWGRFVGISSNSIGLATPGMRQSMALKMGMLGFMRGLASDVASDWITCNAGLPGLTRTPATDPMTDAQRRATWQGQAIQRFAEPADGG